MAVSIADGVNTGSISPKIMEPCDTRPVNKPTSVELFSGAGGLALGIASAGFQHRLLLENNKHACSTLRRNRHAFGDECEIYQGDVACYDFRRHRGTTLLAGGVPCQPFSIGGKHRAHEDERNLFPQFMRAQREIMPDIVLVENVKGLVRESLADFVEYVELQLAHPTVLGEDPLYTNGWREHLPRLREVNDKGEDCAPLQYNVRKAILNAADYGVPQRRERVFFVAIRKDLDSIWLPPAPTHSRAALQLALEITGDYWKRHGVSGRVSRVTDPRREELQRRAGPTRSWTTVRDVLVGLPKPKDFQECEGFYNHIGQPGARSYPGHTGSPLDAPAKTLKAGVHGVPGGENMIRYPNGVVRYFTVREAARIQTFPDSYQFEGAWSEAMRQIGNAVPVTLAEVVARSVMQSLEGPLVDPCSTAAKKSCSG
jgi:DNA (cytosine-5)-methyltransferase 1